MNLSTCEPPLITCLKQVAQCLVFSSLREAWVPPYLWSQEKSSRQRMWIGLSAAYPSKTQRLSYPQVLSFHSFAISYNENSQKLYNEKLLWEQSMKSDFRCALAVDDSNDSKEAKRLLETLSVKFFLVRFSVSPNSFSLPFLITQQGRWEGLDEIKRFAIEIEWRRRRQKPLSGLDLMRLQYEKVTKAAG